MKLIFNRLLRIGAGVMFFICSILYFVAAIIQFPLWLFTGKAPLTSIIFEWMYDIVRYVEH